MLRKNYRNKMIFFFDRDSNGSIITESSGEVGLLTILNVLQTPPRKDVIRIEHCKVRVFLY